MEGAGHVIVECAGVVRANQIGSIAFCYANLDRTSDTSPLAATTTGPSLALARLSSIFVQGSGRTG